MSSWLTTILIFLPVAGALLVAVAPLTSYWLGSREVGRAQNGLVRSYALALAGGLAVLAVVFLSVR
jgi:Na+-driven multidrug efflux pump